MRNTLTLIWKLLVISLAAGLVLGLVNEITRGPIAAQEAEAANDARFAAFSADINENGERVIKNADGVEIAVKMEPAAAETDNNIYCVYAADDPDKKPIGYVASSKAHGYKSDIEVVIGMDMSYKIVGIIIGANGDFQETAGLGSKVREDCFANQFSKFEFDGKDKAFSEGGGGFRILKGSFLAEKIEAECNTGGERFDAVSGATYSSNAVLTAFNQAAGQLYRQIKEIKGGAD